jgi:undecaprenyl phosphate-alpha-L-ara4FN deformylase
VPGWKCNDLVLKAKAEFPFEHNSDCRGESLFRPVVDGRELSQPQVPVTLPTYDEVLGRNGITHDNYNDHILSLLDPARLNVLTIHAEVEGILCRQMFADFVRKAKAKGWTFVPLGELVRDSRSILTGSVVAKDFPGREGWLACQEQRS